MAVKDHTLDAKIVESAKKEFLEKGFQKASLHKIAEDAGITTGALYTRYKNKDELFTSLVSIVLEETKLKMNEIRQWYLSVQHTNKPADFLMAMRHEEKIYLDILFEHYEECVLILCKSDGSSIAEKTKAMTQYKVEGTVEFFKRNASREFDQEGVAFIVAAQFKYYRLVLERGYDKEKALQCMRTVETFLEAGWRAIFEQIL